MQRITITIDDELLATVDRLCAERGYGSRSEAVRDLVRDAVAPSLADKSGSTPCYGALSYVFDHGTRDLARRLTDEGHHHGVSVASMHVHLTRDDCLEVAVLRGTFSEMQAYAETIFAARERGEATVPTTIATELKFNPFLRARDAADFAARRAAKDSF